MRFFLSFIFLFVLSCKLFAQADYTTTVTFPAGYQLGDYVEFLKVAPINAGSAGYYEISVSYTRLNVAAAATHLASISHNNPALWREVGRVNGNPYTGAGIYNFTIDCNTEYANPRFRIRATGTYGSTTSALTVNIKVRSINVTSAWTALSATGNDLTVIKFLPMTDEWNLYVGSNFSSNGASLAIKALENGNVGIGTTAPDQKLTVNGTVHASSVVVDTNVPTPDYVFKADYRLPTLAEVKAYTNKNHHLPEVPAAAEFEKGGINLGQMNMLLLKKVEELTLYLIEKDKQLSNQEKLNQEFKQQAERLQAQQKQIDALKAALDKLTPKNAK